MKKYKDLIKQAMFFGVVGITTLGIDVAVTSTMYNVVNLPAYIASAVGFMSGFFFNFPVNRKKVFHHSAKDRFTLRVQVMLYVSLSIFNLLSTSILVHVLVSLEIVPIEHAKILVTMLIAVWNFLIFKFFIFAKRHESSDSTPNLLQG